MNPNTEGSQVSMESEKTTVSGACYINDITPMDGMLIRRYLKSKYRLNEVTEQLERLADGEFYETVEVLLNKAKAKYLTDFKNVIYHDEPPPCRLIKESFDLAWVKNVKKFFKRLIFNN